MTPKELLHHQSALTLDPAGRFDEGEIVGLPAPVQRYFRAAVQPGSPLVRTAHLTMQGHIKIGRWIPFRAEQILSPHCGFVWAARAGGLISGSDRYVEGHGAMDWRILGLIPVMRASGPDITRSAAGRAAAEAIWIPTALLPRFGATWSAVGPTEISAGVGIDDHRLQLDVSLTPEGLPYSVHFERWGDPDGAGVFGFHPFGGEFTSHTTFGGLTIPTEGALGWHHGTDRWAEGEFFRFAITDYRAPRSSDTP